MDTGFSLGSVSRSSCDQRQASASLVKWNMIPLIDLVGHSQFADKPNSVRALKESYLNCTVSTDAAKWGNRVVFIERIVSDIFAHCPKDEELFIVSLGSNQLLLEYLIGKTLIEGGYNITFLMVDPGYLAARENFSKLPYLKDFKIQIASVYENEHKVPFVEDKIKFLSRAPNIQKYFKENANVIVIESLPPYSEMIKEMKKYKIETKKEDLLRGSRIVTIDQANAVSFVPAQSVKAWKEKGTDTSEWLPLSIHKLDASSPYINHFALPDFIIDWGCKIYNDGSYKTNFMGAPIYFASSTENDGQPLSFEKVKLLSQWTFELNAGIGKMIDSRVNEIKAENPNIKLSQENVTDLLRRISEIAKTSLPFLDCFYMADYIVDCKEAMDYLASKAGHHYRKTFQFLAHPDTVYEIVEKII